MKQKYFTFKISESDSVDNKIREFYKKGYKPLSIILLHKKDNSYFNEYIILFKKRNKLEILFNL